MNKIIVTIEKGKDMYSAYASAKGFEELAISGQGSTEIEAINDFHVALDGIRELYNEIGVSSPLELIDLTFEYKSTL